MSLNSTPHDLRPAVETAGTVGHVPVMLGEVLKWLNPVAGDIIVDGTFGGGGYSRAILDAAPCRVIAIDRDPDAIAAGQSMVAEFGDRLTLVAGCFSATAEHLQALGIDKVQGVVLDVGVSSMQLDQGQRGFSFQRPGPLDMRMSQAGLSAADVVNEASAELLANIIYQLGDEPRSRAIARAIVAQRGIEPITTTQQLVTAIERATGPQRMKDRTHPATRTFQALRIFVNDELDELLGILSDSERLLSSGGRLVVVSFHSLEDRLVKRFLQARAGKTPDPSRHMPGIVAKRPPSFELLFKGHISPSESEIVINPRARSAKLRAAQRSDAPAWPLLRADLGLPVIERMAH